MQQALMQIEELRSRDVYESVDVTGGHLVLHGPPLHGARIWANALLHRLAHHPTQQTPVREANGVGLPHRLAYHVVLRAGTFVGPREDVA
jgi:hypothetical protein